MKYIPDNLTDKQGQGAIEYLLIIAAAIMVVAVVIIAMTGGVSSGKATVTDSKTDENNQFDELRNPLQEETLNLAAGDNTVIFTLSIPLANALPSPPANSKIFQGGLILDTYNAGTGWSNPNLVLKGVYTINIALGSYSAPITYVAQANNFYGVCGTAARTYSSAETFPTGNLCDVNTNNPIPSPSTLGSSTGNTTTWDCNGWAGTVSGNKVSCTATRQGAVIPSCVVPTQATGTLLYSVATQISCNFTMAEIGHTGVDYVAMIKPSGNATISISNPVDSMQIWIYDEVTLSGLGGPAFIYYTADDEDNPSGVAGWYNGANLVTSMPVTNNQRFMIRGAGTVQHTLTLTPTGTISACPVPTAGTDKLHPNTIKYFTPVNCTFTSSIGTFDSTGYGYNRTSYIQLKGNGGTSKISITPSVPGEEFGYDSTFPGSVRQYYFVTQAQVDDGDYDYTGWTGPGGIYPAVVSTSTLDIVTNLISGSSTDMNFYIKVPTGNSTTMTLTITRSS